MEPYKNTNNIIYKMDIFYIIVLSVAVMLLILILTYIGIKMVYNRNTSGNTFPPSFSPCPDYWQTDSAGHCVVPSSTATNRGAGTYTSSNTPGYSDGNIDFTASAWTTNGSSICSKRTWANSNNVVWDGITNYNGCT